MVMALGDTFQQWGRSGVGNLRLASRMRPFCFQDVPCANSNIHSPRWYNTALSSWSVTEDGLTAETDQAIKILVDLALILDLIMMNFHYVDEKKIILYIYFIVLVGHI